MCVRVDRGAARARARDDGEISYDYLILATGATHAYFGHDEWRGVAPGLKTLEDALEIRRRVLLAYERAERETGSGEARRAAHVRRHWRRADRRRARGCAGGDLAAITGARFPSFRSGFGAHRPGRSWPVAALGVSGNACARPRRKILKRLGVEVRTGHARHRRRERTRRHGGNEAIDAATVLWAAGVAASPLGVTLGVPTDRAGRVMVQPDLTIPGHPDLFVIGDLGVVHWSRRTSRCRESRRSRSRWVGMRRQNIVPCDSDSQPYRPFVYQRSRQHGHDRPRLGDR